MCFSFSALLLLFRFVDYRKVETKLLHATLVVLAREISLYSYVQEIRTKKRCFTNFL